MIRRIFLENTLFVITIFISKVASQGRSQQKEENQILRLLFEPDMTFANGNSKQLGHGISMVSLIPD